MFFGELLSNWLHSSLTDEHRPGRKTDLSVGSNDNDETIAMLYIPTCQYFWRGEYIHV